VLIVESERERLLRDEEKLAALGYEPVGFEKADDALAACRSEPDRFDLIVISAGWQTLEGLDLARAIAEAAPSRPILLAVASSIDISGSALAEAGVSEVLPWPLATAELASTLERCLRARGMLQL
jgi:DNA-binding response OmpR family regulator